MPISERCAIMGGVTGGLFGDEAPFLFEGEQTAVEEKLTELGADVTWDVQEKVESPSALRGTRGTIRFVFTQGVGDTVLVGFVYIPGGNVPTTAYQDMKKYGIQIMPVADLFERWTVTAERSTWQGGG